MSSGLLIKNIKCLVQTEDIVRLKVCGTEMSQLGTLSDAFLYIKDGLIHDFGSDLIETVILKGKIINSKC